MADASTVIACPRCWIPTSTLLNCPDCGTKLRVVNSLSLAAMHILVQKGYKPIKCTTRGYGKGKKVAVVFEGMSPGPGVHHEMICDIERGRPVCITARWQGSSSMNCFRAVHEWAFEVHHGPSTKFNREMCERCAEQPDKLWLHGAVRCVACGDDFDKMRQHEMNDGIPEKCVYAAEHVVTMHERMAG